MPAPGLLGDTPARNYVDKLRRFNAHAQPELRRAIASLALTSGMRVVDVGCGSGETLNLLHEAVGPDSLVVGLDLAAAHVRSARAQAHASILIAQADAQHPPLARASVDLIWSVNTLNHLRDPAAALRQFATVLRSGGRIALGQSALLPEMYFAWDARLEHAVNEAVRHYYRERYALDERELSAIRALLGLLRAAGLRDVWTRTFVIERVSPLRAQDEAYLLEAIFRDTWGERLQPFLEPADYALLSRLCDPHDPQYALARPDFHYLQTFTLAVGQC
jgi:SAM-dependent methyltransferase